MAATTGDNKMGTTPLYTITLRVDESSVAICIAFARGTEQPDIDRGLNRITEAIARVEGLDHRMMAKFLFQSRETIEEDGIRGYIVSREFIDPRYPDRLKEAIQGIGMMPVSNLPQLH